MSALPPPDAPDAHWPPQLTAWERATHMPLLALALLFLVAYAVPILYPGVPDWARTAATGVYVLVWAVYAVDLAVRVVMAGRGNRLRFLVTHPLDLLMVLLPLLRPLRVVRVVVLLTEVFRRHAEASKRFQAAFYVVTVTTMILVVSSLAILDAERGSEGTQIADLDDAMWWSIVTATTVGYGDMVPQTVEGRAIAAFLMFAGIGLFGLVSGSLASWFVDRVSSASKTAERAEADELRERMDRLERQVGEIHAALVRDRPSPVRQRAESDPD
ncbi:ion transporter [Glycomyces sp. TRM65418]|uniref:potassium channel family protein n=1 Tax=Glycomyces sp. TRM65418 TaxID=2867006 RepID=UPI001CE525BF|nr:potassium channel family protein [Glycomyces sp. TRM65418]MCC3763520.1 ion transporter [Glycomyces sp. TRM65418]QZD57504.1 ion transporter [Glycomyces sp. TRM65418]